MGEQGVQEAEYATLWGPSVEGQRTCGADVRGSSARKRKRKGAATCSSGSVKKGETYNPWTLTEAESKAGSQVEQLSEVETSHGSLLQDCLHMLALIYTSLQAKNPLRRASALSSVPDWLQEQTVGWLSGCLSVCPLSAQTTPHAASLPVTGVHSLLTEVLQFLQKALLSEYLQLKRRHSFQEAMCYRPSSCLAAAKASMLVVQRSQEPISATLQATHLYCTLQLTLSGLLDCYTHILTDEFVQSVQSMVGQAAGLLQGSEQVGECAPVWLRQSCTGLYDSGRPTGLFLYLCHGALAMLNWRILFLMIYVPPCAPCATPAWHGAWAQPVLEWVSQQLLQSRHREAFKLAYVGFVHLTDMLCCDSGQVILYPSLFLLLLVLELLFPFPMDRSSSTLGLAPFMPFIR
eukprot:XP_014054070.1 PREDICTED: thyroid adenoma-associated protein [Salmo salar]